MTYEPLHHKYRPQTFADLVGQSAIATTLSNALISERIAPAYLFTGPRGTGKTSSARILAKSLNCLSSDHPTPIPCGKCSVCQAIANGSALDVIEIDAASNTGVDNIREIIERSQFAPVQCRYKVYVIDECLTGDSLVFTETGLIPINHPEILGKRVLSYNESSGEWEYKKVLRWLNRGVKATLTIQTRNRTINCTGNHLIRTEKAWIQAKNLKIGDQILSPVNVTAGNSSLSMEGMDITDVSFQGIKTTAIVTEQESMTWPLFCNRLNPSSPFVSVAVGKNWKFPCFSNKKAEGSKVLNPIGKDILTNKDTVYGKSEPKNYCSIENLCPQTASDLYTGLYSEMELSITPTKTVDGREYAGIMAVNNKNGLNTKPVVFQSYKFSHKSLPTVDMENFQSMPAAFVIPALEKFSRWSDLKENENLFPSIGWKTSHPKDWLGGIWMTDHSVSPLTEAVLSNYTRKDIPPPKINLLPIGSLKEVTLQKAYPILDTVRGRSIITSKWEHRPQPDGLPIYNPMQSPQWLTNFEEVIGIQEGDTESVYDLEVEDNHNFVANGLLVHNCHMLSTAAFNALLKTLEEPPDRVIFVLATTDPQRVLPTIISRCQRFDYRRIALDAMVAHLQKIAQIEAIDINLEALTLVAQIANGGLRDAESLLDQLSLLAGTITAERVWDLVGAVPERDLLTLLKVIHGNIPDQVIEQCRHLMNRGKEPLIVLQNLAGFYLNLLLAKTAPNRPEMVAVTAPTWQELCTEARTWSLEEILRGQQLLKDSETQLKNTTQPRLWLEVTLLGLLPQAQVIPLVATVAPSRPQTSAERPPEVITAPAPVNEPIKPAVITPTTSVAVPKTEVKTVASDDNNEQIWQQVLEVMEPPTTRTLLRQHGSLFNMEESSAYLSISSEQLLKMARLRLTNIESAFEAVFQRRIKVHLQVGSATAAMAAEVSQSPAARIQPPPETAATPPITPENKVMTVVDIPPVKEAIIEKKEAKITASGTPKTPSTELPQKILNFDSSLETLDQDVDVSEILAAAQKLAKSFDGELVNMGYSVPENSAVETKVNKSLENMTIVRGRPDVNEILDSLEEDEDLPF
ncbi:MAG: DNA polymerase III subunit gamma/tau [Microcystis sp. M049S2]|uniref:DNA polymerase III subunit gamma/tau n=1 Tax=Microcystis sp. M049S2 TaxID=2771169 RepID=UPI0033902DA2|nr:DNA polymerase III subunit gamma/tau [Microcystis sp. M049S2]